MKQGLVEDFRGRLSDWDRFLSEHPRVPLLYTSSSTPDLANHIRNLRRRLREGPRSPVRVAFFGATGAGKSKLFSSLIGASISPSGYRRPFTRQTCIYLHQHWHALKETLQGEVHLHQDDAWRDYLFLDTPDFDSVAEENRAEAARVFHEADAFVFVADGTKYADASNWTYLQAIHVSSKELIIVLNKVNTPAILESFLDRFRGSVTRDDPTAILPNPIVVPELRIQDDELIPSSEPPMHSLRQVVSSLRVDDGPTDRRRMLRLEAESLFGQASRLRDEVHRRRQQVHELRETMARRLQESQLRLQDRLSVSLDADVRDEVFQRVLNRIEKMDILRYPRQILSMPAKLARRLLVDWWRPQKSAELTLSAEKPDDPTTQESFQLLEAEALQLANQLRLDISGQPGFEELLTRDRFRGLRPDNEALQQQFRILDARFREWVADHARETAAQITTGNKTKFFLSQLLFNSVIVTAQVHAGGFSLMDLGLDSVVSPFMAKGIGMLIGNEKVKEFEEEARREHKDLLGQVLTDVKKGFQDFLEESSAGLDALQENLDEILTYSHCVPELIQQFASGTMAAATTGSMVSEIETAS